MKISIHKFSLLVILIFASANIFGQVPYYYGPSSEIKKIVTIADGTISNTQEILLDPPVKPTNINLSQYGTSVPVNIPLSNQSRRSSIKEGSWSIKISSANALTLDFTLSNIKINKKTKIYIYDENKTTVMGPIMDSSLNVKANTISTVIFPGNTVYIKVIEPVDNPSTSFTLSRVTHGFSSTILSKYYRTTANARLASTASVDCIPDITCQYGWGNEREMVGLFIVNGKGGTGTFVNNEAQNRRPFFLTAFHVVDSDSDNSLSTSEINALGTCSVRIDNRTNTCNGTVAFGTTYTGAILRSAWEPSDFCLIELFTTPPIDQLVNYAGWNRNNTAPSKATSIHHPNLQNMRYSTSTNGGVGQHPFYPKFWKVSNWDVGVVASGSSGCALFNEHHQVVGQLIGGASSCTFQDFGDRYGKFSESWYGGETANTQLKAWLSPNQDLGSMSHLLPLTITGGASICYGSNSTVTMPFVLPGETATWSVSGNLSIVGSTNNSVTVTPTYSSGSGTGTVTATFGSMQANQNVYYGTPDVYAITYDNNIPASTYNYVSANTSHDVYLDLANAIAANITSTNWNPNPNIGYSWGQHFASYNFSLNSGDVLYFNPLSATNQCGTAYRTLAFASSSSYLVYPNPATTNIFIEFNSVKNIETLPDEINLISEVSVKIVKSVSVKDIFNKKAFNGENKIILDVKDLPRGRYYLQVKDDKIKQKVEPIRIILTD